MLLSGQDLTTYSSHLWSM